MSLRYVRRGRAQDSAAALRREEDPLAGAANLFDVSLAFIVALIIAMFTLFSVEGLLNPDQELTMLVRSASGELTLISQTRELIEVQRVTDRQLSGEGTRLGTAYQLPGGQVIYVPDGSDDAAP